MNSMDRTKKKRKVIRRLDFENCEVTTVKMEKKFRRRLKAKITSQYEDVCTSPEQVGDESQSSSATSTQNSAQSPEYSSPILLRKHSSPKRITETPSPILLTKHLGNGSVSRVKRRKLTDENEHNQSVSVYEASPDSPILVFKSTCTKNRSEAVEDTESGVVTPPLKPSTCRSSRIEDTKVIFDVTPDRSILHDGFNADLSPRVGSIAHSEVSPKGTLEPIIDEDEKDADGSTYKIEDFSQDPSESAPVEFRQETKISSFSSESRSFSQLNILEDPSSESHPMTEEPQVPLNTPTKEEEESVTVQYDSSPMLKKRRLKKDGLVVRLINLRKRQESERRIREHKNKIMKDGEKWKKFLHVLELWRDGMRLILKCQQLDVSDESATVTTAGENVYVILSKDFGNKLKKIKDGAFLRIAPPWQELRLRTLNSSILLSVTSVELIDNIPGVVAPALGMREAAISKYKEDEASFFDALLKPETSVFLRPNDSTLRLS